MYMNAKVGWFDCCENDSWSCLWIEDFLEQLGYMNTEELKVYWCLPRKSVCDGLRKVDCDADTNCMVSMVPRYKTLTFYVDHNNMISAPACDDIIVDTQKDLLTSRWLGG